MPFVKPTSKGHSKALVFAAQDFGLDDIDPFSRLVKSLLENGYRVERQFVGFFLNQFLRAACSKRKEKNQSKENWQKFK